MLLDLEYFMKDTHYRNCFEVHVKGKKYKKDRIKREGDLFNNVYTKASYFDKPKYGTLNFLND